MKFSKTALCSTMAALTMLSPCSANAIEPTYQTLNQLPGIEQIIDLAGRESDEMTFFFADYSPVSSSKARMAGNEDAVQSLADTTVRGYEYGATRTHPTYIKGQDVSEILANAKIRSMEQFTPEEETVLAKLVYGEGRGVSKMEQAAIVWCVLNRVDCQEYYDNDIISVATAPYQFVGYRAKNPVDEEILELVRDVLYRWSLEKAGEEDVGRVLPQEYIYFYGDGKHNYFTTSQGGKQTWDWSLENPYENIE